MNQRDTDVLVETIRRAVREEAQVAAHYFVYISTSSGENFERSCTSELHGGVPEELSDEVDVLLGRGVGLELLVCRLRDRRF